MRIGDSVFVHGYVDEIRKDIVIIRNRGGYFGTDKSEVITGEPKTGEWTNAGVLTVHCSNCKSEFHELEAMNFCPNCGARMKGADDEREDIQSTDE